MKEESDNLYPRYLILGMTRSLMNYVGVQMSVSTYRIYKRREFHVMKRWQGENRVEQGLPKKNVSLVNIVSRIRVLKTWIRDGKSNRDSA
jgi:hypothetical protein